MHAAGVHIVGYVRDAVSREPVPMVTVSIPDTEMGVTGNEMGGFTVDLDVETAVLRFTAVGYHPQDVVINPGQAVLVVDMQPASVELSELEVNQGKERYSKKNNPAVELVERLRRHMRDTDPLQADYYDFEKYQRILYGFNDIDEMADRYKLSRRFAFLHEYADTSLVTGKRVLPVSVREQVSHEYYQNNSRKRKEVVTALRSGGIDESMDQNGMKQYLEDMFREVDIFQNDIALLDNRFVSPLSVIGPDFYRYYLTDTVLMAGCRCVELSFVPRTPEAFGFTGRLYVALDDSACFVTKVLLNVPHKINLNYVQRLSIEQDFERSDRGLRLKTRDEVEAEFRLISAAPGLFARRETRYRGHRFEPPADMGVFELKGETTVAADAEYMPDEFWTGTRPHAVRSDANSVARMLARLRESKGFYWLEKVIVAFLRGYVPTGNPSRFDVGPINTVISGNPLEGVRLRLGGVTTVELNRHWFARAYAAYGFRDRRWKYMGQLEYSFTEKKNLDQEFPIHSLRLMHRYDVDHLGLHFTYTNPDNMFLVLKRQRDDKTAYLRRTELEWKREWPNHFSLALTAEHLVHESSRFIAFELPDGTELRRYSQAGFRATIRFAPGEKFYQARSYRIPINMDAPIVTISHTWHPKGWMGSRYELNKTELGVQKRFWFSAFGYTDVIIKGAKVWGKAAYPDLLLPNANLSYSIQPESYALMDAMEFVNDQYVSWDVTYWANGALLNRVPLVKYLKLREVFTFRGIWGSLSARNNPAKAGDVFQFPGTALCQPMGSKPYMEIGVGLDNILTIIRLDYVWRLTYRGTPGVDRSGLRVALHLTF